MSTELSPAELATVRAFGIHEDDTPKLGDNE